MDDLDNFDININYQYPVSTMVDTDIIYLLILRSASVPVGWYHDQSSGWDVNNHWLTYR